jgi:hypothetical protein
MKHLEINLQNGIIFKENYPIGVYSKHKNTLVITNPPQLIATDMSVNEKEVVDYVLDNGILSRSTNLKVKQASSLGVSYMTNKTFKMKHV